MKMTKRNRGLTILVATLFLVVSCTGYKSQQVSFRHPSSYAQMQTVAGAQVAAEPYADKAVAKEAFGFDILSAGLLPVQVVIDNQGQTPLEIVPDQTFLIDQQGGMWNILSRRDASDRLSKSTEYARVASKSGHSALYGAVGGALIGAAIGIVTGENVGDAALKGGVIGGTGGAILGGGKELADKSTEKQISRDMDQKEILNRPLEPGSLGRGFLFFPAEAKSARELRIQFREIGTDTRHTVTLGM